MMEASELLKKTWGEIPKVQTLPFGHYLLKLRNAVYKEGLGDANPFFMFVYVPQYPMDDVDQSALSELGAEYDVTSNRIFHRFWVETGADLDTVRNHIVLIGEQVKGLEKMSIEDSLKAIKGAEVAGLIDTRTFTDKTGNVREENYIVSFAKAE